VGRSKGLRWFCLGLLVLGLATAGGVLLAGYGYRWQWWSLGSAFQALRPLAYAGVAVALLALVATGLCLMLRRWRLALVPIAARAAGFIAFGLPFSLQSRAAGVPAIHDITTDFTDPPQFVSLRKLREDTPNGANYGGSIVADQQRAAYGDIAPVILPLSPTQALAKAQAVAQAMGWQVVSAGDGQLEATATTPWFGFKDDVIIRIRPDGSGSRIDVRSVSRIGSSDLGANAARVRQTIERLRQ